jgi:ABC-type dipeptide/oligopeptide/nickel transport system permease component
VEGLQLARLGLYTVKAITRLDYPAVMGTSLLITFTFILINLLVTCCTAADLGFDTEP